MSLSSTDTKCWCFFISDIIRQSVDYSLGKVLQQIFQRVDPDLQTSSLPLNIVVEMWWITGNEYLHLLTSTSPARRYALRVDLTDFDGETRFAEYENFTIASVGDNYRLGVEGYSGNAGLSVFYTSDMHVHKLYMSTDRGKCLKVGGGSVSTRPFFMVERALWRQARCSSKRRGSGAI